MPERISEGPITIKGKEAKRLIKAIDAEKMLIVNKNEKGEVEIDWRNSK